MQKKYSKLVHEVLTSNKKNKLKILLEEDDPFGDLNFGDSDDDKKDDDKKDDDDSKEDDTEDTGSSDDTEDTGSSADTTELDQESLSTLSDQVSFMRNFFEKVKKNDGTSSVENYISSAVSANLNADSLKLLEKFLRTENLLSKILLEKKDEDDLDTVEAEIDDLDRVLTKGSEIVDKFKKGKDIDIQSYVDAAVNAFKNFDSLFAKELIVKQATINVLILNSGSKAEQNIAEFEELFHEELNKQFNIEYDEFALITNKEKTAAGAKSQG